VASFEAPVRNLQQRFNHIDLLWRGMVLIEHKSTGRSMEAAELQAFDYIQDLAREQRDNDIPRYIVVSDFARIALYDLEPDEQLELNNRVPNKRFAKTVPNDRGCQAYMPRLTPFGDSH